MIDIRLIRENPELVRENIRKKFQDAKLPLVDEVIELDKANRAAINEASNLRAERNTLSKQIGMLMGQAKKDPSKLAEAEAVKAQVTAQAARLAELEQQEAELEAKGKELEAKAFRKILRTLKSNFDHVLIDAPAGIERSLRGLLSNEINECVLVCTPDDVCIRNAERTASVLRKKGLTAQRVIVNRLNPDYIRRGEMYAAQTVALTLDMPLLGEIPEDAEIYRALLHHQSVMEGESEGRNAIARIALRMTTGEDVPLPEYGQKRTLFQRLFQRRRKGDEKHVR